MMQYVSTYIRLVVGSSPITRTKISYILQYFNVNTRKTTAKITALFFDIGDNINLFFHYFMKKFVVVIKEKNIKFEINNIKKPIIYLFVLNNFNLC